MNNTDLLKELNLELIQAINVNNECYKVNRQIKPVGIVVHSTGANNKTLKRYCDNEEELGVNVAGNHWNQFRPNGRQVCVHAFIGLDKHNKVAVAQTLPFTTRCWGCGSGRLGSYNNSHIQFEICEDNLTDPKYFKQVYEKAVDFCAYLCKLYNIEIKNIVCHSEAYKLGYGSNHADVMYWFPEFGKSMDTFRKDVETKLNKINTDSIKNNSLVEEKETDPSTSLTNEEYVWNALMSHFNNAVGVAGLMGNLQAESNFNPTNLQNSYNKKLNLTDSEYTERIDENEYTNFVIDSAGYGLAQWTYWSRKEGLYRLAKETGKSIGDIDLQLEYLIDELKKYKNVYETIKNSNDLMTVSNKVLMEYEKPADQSITEQLKRYKYSVEILNKFRDKQVGKEPDQTTEHNNTTTSQFKPYLVRVNASALNIRNGAGTGYKIVGCIRDKGVYTIVEEKGSWGKLKSGIGWICLSYTSKI